MISRSFFFRILRGLLWVLAALSVVAAIISLEAERATVSERTLDTDVGEVSLYSNPTGAPGPLVVVTHGFAGSRQMMQYISRDLARSGLTVAAFDFYGHGRNPERMSSDVTRIEGTTQQLVAQTRAVLEAVQSEIAIVGPVGMLGHSMATDIVIRAAKAASDVSAIVAISMYSEAVTADFPQKLLVISGEYEGRLRDVARETVALVAGASLEGETVSNGPVTRRAVAIPNTEHVAVLFAAQTKREARDWFRAAFDLRGQGQAMPQGLAITGVLLGLIVLFWPLARILPTSRTAAAPVRARVFWLALLAPIVPAVGLSLLLGGALFQSAGFGALAVFFATWGAVVLAILWAAGHRPGMPKPSGVLLLTFWSLVIFAVALDRYAAAFLPTGPRVSLMAVLLLGTVPFMLADRVLLDGAALWQRVVARIVPVAALSASMILFSQKLGLLFTVLPVMVLFYLVYGTMARAVALRQGAETAGVGSGIVLAWSIAASSPLFLA
ncbi:alpha/beta hydrolase [Roseobacter denitrificans]|nr:alpha/beta fold hydrolase [Roseobacter denitrificans]AVL52046.1 alpha/beta hydrolase [Roseobacter denitrificans]SFF92741.1 Serine aminopeptidase, S33 [Roseobacter denitrificans OCh 114]